MEKFSHADESDVNYITATANQSEVEKICSESVSSTLDIETNAANAEGPDCQPDKVVASAATKYEPNISDSVISLRNCSTILHTSSNNHTIYRASSPSETAAALVRKTSTPMHQNMIVSEGGDRSESMMCSCSVSSTSCHVSSIHGSHSSESDTSPVSHSSSGMKYTKSHYTR